MSVAAVGRLTAEQKRIRAAIVEIAQAALDVDADSTVLRLVGRETMGKLLEVLRVLCTIEGPGLVIWFGELTHAVEQHNRGDLTADGPDYWDAMMTECLDRLTCTR